MLTYNKALGGLEPFDIPNLHNSLRKLLINEVYNDIITESSTVEEISNKIRRKVPIYKMEKKEAFKNVSGVDAGSQILNLASRRYAILSALVYSIPSGSKYYLEPETVSFPYTSVGEKYLGVINIRREAKLYETALSFINSNNTVELLLIDGPLAFSNWWSLSGSKKDRLRLISSINKLICKCQNENITLAGIVKRPSARYLIYTLDLHKTTDLPDSYLLHQTLMPGERTDIFSPRAAAKKIVHDRPFMDYISCPIYSFYCRPSKEWDITPVRVDIPSFSIDYMEEVADYCFSSSYCDGIPFPILRADEEVKITKRFIKEVYGDLICKVNREIGEIGCLVPYWGERL